MDVSIDGLRSHLISSYNSLVRKLNENNINSEVRVPTSYIQKNIDDIKSCIVILSCMYMEGEFMAMTDVEFETFNPREIE